MYGSTAACTLTAWLRFGTASVGPAADRYIARSDGTAGMAVAREWDQRREAADLDRKTPVNLHLSQHRLHLQLRQSPAASTALNGREVVQSHMRMEIELVKRHGMRRVECDRPPHPSRSQLGLAIARRLLLLRCCLARCMYTLRPTLSSTRMSTTKANGYDAVRTSSPAVSALSFRRRLRLRGGTAIGSG